MVGVEHLTASSEYISLPSVIINSIIYIKLMFSFSFSILYIFLFMIYIMYKKDRLQLIKIVIEETVDLW